MTKNSKKPNLEIRDRKNFTAADVSFCDAMVGHVWQNDWSRVTVLLGLDKDTWNLGNPDKAEKFALTDLSSVQISGEILQSNF